MKLAPTKRRGAYLGVFNAGVPLALAVVPSSVSRWADAAGDTAMWVLVAALGGVAALSFAAFANLSRKPARDEPGFDVAPVVD